MSPTREILNAAKNLYGACLSILPSPVARYANENLDTASKFLSHVLLVMSICNFFLMSCSFGISFLTFLACFLLSVQCTTVALTATSVGQAVAPQLFAPTEFMLGVCLGITIGGTILSFFLCLTFGRIHAYCAHHLEGPESCGWEAASLNGIWWWSSCIFWLNLISSFLLVLSHSDISTTSIPRYHTLDQDDSTVGRGAGSSSASVASSSFSQYQGGHFARPPAQYGNGGGYNDVPDVASSSPDPTHPLQPNVLQV